MNPAPTQPAKDEPAGGGRPFGRPPTAPVSLGWPPGGHPSHASVRSLLKSTIRLQRRQQLGAPRPPRTLGQATGLEYLIQYRVDRPHRR